MGRNEVSPSVLKWSEGLTKRVSIIIKRYTDHMRFAVFFHILLFLFRIIVYMIVCLFNFVNYVFLLLSLYMVFVM